MGSIRRLRVAVVLLASLTVAGCTSLGLTPEVCTAIAWFNHATVNLTGNVEDVASVELCEDGVCAASTAVLQGPLEQPRLTTPGPQDLKLGSPAPQPIAPEDSAVPSLMFSTIRTNESTWRVTFDGDAPETFTLRALSSTGAVLVEREVQLDWRRVGGSEQCGGPNEAGPVILDIPS